MKNLCLKNTEDILTRGIQLDWYYWGSLWFGSRTTHCERGAYIGRDGLKQIYGEIEREREQLWELQRYRRQANIQCHGVWRYWERDLFARLGFASRTLFPCSSITASVEVRITIIHRTARHSTQHIFQCGSTETSQNIAEIQHTLPPYGKGCCAVCSILGLCVVLVYNG